MSYIDGKEVWWKPVNQFGSYERVYWTAKEAREEYKRDGIETKGLIRLEVSKKQPYFREEQ